MAHKLLRITQKLYSVPHLITKTSFENITRYLESRNRLDMFPDDSSDDTPISADEPTIFGGIGVIEINGPLTYKTTGWEAICGGCSYEGILEQAEELIENEVQTIVLSFDSGGGEAYGVFLAAKQLRTMCDDAGVRLVAYVDGCCASAAYAIACVCDEIVSNPYSEVGSIGVLIALMDQSKHLEQEGYKPIFISAGAQKIPYAEDGSFKKEFLADLQMKVDVLYDAFVSHVAEYTGLDSNTIKDTEAKTFLAQDALDIGLVNKIMSNTEFVTYMVGDDKGQDDVEAI